jgi:hypothetical protein
VDAGGLRDGPGDSAAWKVLWIIRDETLVRGGVVSRSAYRARPSSGPRVVVVAVFVAFLRAARRLREEAVGERDGEARRERAQPACGVRPKKARGCKRPRADAPRSQPGADRFCEKRIPPLLVNNRLGILIGSSVPYWILLPIGFGMANERA